MSCGGWWRCCGDGEQTGRGRLSVKTGAGTTLTDRTGSGSQDGETGPGGERMGRSSMS